MRRAWRLTKIWFTLAIYAIAAPFGYAAFALISLIPTRDPIGRARRLQGVMRRAFILMHDWLRWTRLMDFDPRQIEGLMPQGPCILVANHPTLADVTAIMASFGHMTTVVKPVLYRRWWLRPLLKSAALFEGSGANHAELSRVMQSATTWMHQGFCFLLFPEGTRSPYKGVHPYGRVAFELACRADVPVVPLVLHSDPVWLSKEFGLLRPPKGTPRLRIKALRAEHPRDHGHSSRKLRDVIESKVRSQLDAAPGG